jgi:hypothetical protein
MDDLFSVLYTSPDHTASSTNTVCFILSSVGLLSLQEEEDNGIVSPSSPSHDMLQCILLLLLRFPCAMLALDCGMLSGDDLSLLISSTESLIAEYQVADKVVMYNSLHPNFSSDSTGKFNACFYDENTTQTKRTFVVIDLMLPLEQTSGSDFILPPACQTIIDNIFSNSSKYKSSTSFLMHSPAVYKQCIIRSLRLNNSNISRQHVNDNPNAAADSPHLLLQHQQHAKDHLLRAFQDYASGIGSDGASAESESESQPGRTRHIVGQPAELLRCLLWSVQRADHVHGAVLLKPPPPHVELFSRKLLAGLRVSSPTGRAPPGLHSGGSGDSVGKGRGSGGSFLARLLREGCPVDSAKEAGAGQPRVVVCLSEILFNGVLVGQTKLSYDSYFLPYRCMALYFLNSPCSIYLSTCLPVYISVRLSVLMFAA